MKLPQLPATKVVRLLLHVRSAATNRRYTSSIYNGNESLPFTRKYESTAQFHGLSSTPLLL